MSEAKPAFAPTYEEAVRLAAPYCKAMVEADMALAAVDCADPLAATIDGYRYRLRERAVRAVSDPAGTSASRG